MGIRGALAVIALLSLAARASAADETLALDASADALAALGIDADRLRYHARVETGASLVQSPDEALLRAFVDPTRDGASVAVTLVDRGAARTDSRLVALGNVAPDERARVIALALSEMLRARRATPAVRPVVPAVPAPPVLVPLVAPIASPIAPAPESTPDTRSRSSALAADLSAGAAYFSRQGSSLVDVQLAGEARLAPAFWARAEGGLAYGARTDSAGDVQLVLPSLGIGLRLRTDPRARFSAGVGPTLGVGVAFASASAGPSARATAENALTLRASIDADGRLRVGGPVYLLATISCGAMIRGADVRADDRAVLSASGLALGARGGLGVSVP